MPTDAGTAVLDVIPGLDGFARRLQAGVDPVLRRATGNVKVDADTSLFRRKVDTDVDRTSRNVEHRLGGAFRNVFALAGGLGAGLATISFFKGAFEEAEEARKTLAQTEAVLKSTGGAARVSANDVDTLATRLSNLTGIDDEAIAANENLLLTFTGIRNEAGKGNDIFNQATKTVLDMSVALGQDGKSSAIQLGKALNDPIKGITALQRVGVSFTQQQRDQIRTLVESGHTLDAQKIILGELNKEFGGSAEAAASPLQKLGVQFNNIKESVGTAFLPMLQAAASFLADKLPGAVEVATRVFGRVRDAVVGVFDLFVNRDFSSAFAQAFGVEEDAPIVNTLFQIRDGLASVVEFIRSNWQPIVAALVVGFGAWAVSAGLAAAATIAAAAPVYAAVAAIAALVAGLIYAYTHWEGFRNVVDATVRFLTGTVVPAIQALVAGIAQQFSNLVGWVRDNWAQISEAISHVIAVIRAVIDAYVVYVTFLWRTFGDEILAIARVVWDQIRNVVETVITIVRNIIQVVLALINGDWGQAWDGIKAILAAAWEYIRETVVNALRIVGQVVEAGLSLIRVGWDLAWNAVKSTLSAIWEGIKSVVGGAIDWVKTKIGDVLGAVEGIWNRVWGGLRDGLGGIWEGIKGAVRDGINGLIGIVNTLIRGANTLLGHLPGNLELPEIPGLQGGGPVPVTLLHAAWGGVVPGTGSGDKVPALLEPGEFVVRKRAVQAVGVDALYELNARRYQLGGLVDIARGVGRSLTNNPITDAVGAVVRKGADILGDIVRLGARAVFAPIKAAAKAALEGVAGSSTLGRGIAGVGLRILDGVENLIGEKDDQRAKEAAATAAAAAVSGAGGAIGSGQIGQGWQAITNWLSSVGEPYTITSTTGGTHVPGSYHYQGKAVDLISGNMMHLFNTLLGIGGSLSELFYDPAGFSIKNGARANFTVGGHSDHVHAATFHQGGLVPGSRGQEVLAMLEAGEMVTPRGDVDAGAFIDYDRLAKTLAQELRKNPPIVRTDSVSAGFEWRRTAYQ